MSRAPLHHVQKFRFVAWSLQFDMFFSQNTTEVHMIAAVDMAEVRLVVIHVTDLSPLPVGAGRSARGHH